MQNTKGFVVVGKNTFLFFCTVVMHTSAVSVCSTCGMMRQKQHWGPGLVLLKLLLWIYFLC